VYIGENSFAISSAGVQGLGLIFPGVQTGVVAD
jgi:hypothetical protein